MHVSPAKHSYAWLPRKCDYQTCRRTETDAGQSDPYVLLCFEGDTKTKFTARNIFSICFTISKSCRLSIDSIPASFAAPPASSPPARRPAYDVAPPCDGMPPPPPGKGPSSYASASPVMYGDSHFIHAMLFNIEIIVLILYKHLTVTKPLFTILLKTRV